MASNVQMVTNPSFETDLAGWTFFNAAATRDNSQSIPGAAPYSCKLVATSTGATMGATYLLTGLTPGTAYTASFYAKIQSAVAGFSVVPSIDGQFSPRQPLSVNDGYTRRYMGFRADATTATLRVQSEGAPTVGDTIWFDRVQVNEGGLMPYFDGSYPYSSWTGTPHASTSICSAFDSALVGHLTTDEVVIVNGLCLNTLAWNITTKTGRYTVPGVRGDDITIPGANGKLFVPNKPIDSGLFSLSMFVLGARPDGSVPDVAGQRTQFERNYEQLIRTCMNNWSLVDIYVWQPNGTVRTTKATLIGNSPDATLFMGGRRAEVTLAFETILGVWSDYLPTTVTGTPSASWSNGTLLMPTLADSTASIDEAVVTVTGPITNPTLSNAATGTSVTFTGSVPAGQSWVVDCSQWTSKVNGASVLAATTHHGHPRFLLIAPGSVSSPPSISLVGSGTTAATNLAVTASRKHLIG